MNLSLFCHNLWWGGKF